MERSPNAVSRVARLPSLDRACRRALQTCRRAAQVRDARSPLRRARRDPRLTVRPGVRRSHGQERQGDEGGEYAHAYRHRERREMQALKVHAGVQEILPGGPDGQVLHRSPEKGQDRMDLGGAVHRLQHLHQGARSRPTNPGHPAARGEGWADVFVGVRAPQKCPFEAIQIINLPKNLNSNMTHR